MKQEPEYKILFVCMGNICRSPTAEGVMRRMLAERRLGERVAVDSAGTGGYHIGSAPDARSQAAAAKRGVDLSKLRARQIAPADLEAFDLILTMDETNYADVSALAARHGGRARVARLMDYAGGGEVPDPYFGEGDGFERVLDAVESGCRGLIDEVAARL